VSSLALKADKTYVDTQDALKADKTYVDTQDALKADKTYVDTQDGALSAAVAAKAPTASPTFTGTVTVPTPTAGDNSTKAASTAFVVTALAANAGTIPRGHLSGLTLSTVGASTTFSVAAGQAVDSTASAAMSLSSPISKTTSAFVAGTGSGSLDTGSIAPNTWYHVWLIAIPSGAVDVLVSLSASAPTMPGAYTLKRRIGSMKTNGFSQWTKFVQNGDNFIWDSPVADVGVVNPGTAAVTRTFSTPTGVITQAILFVVLVATSGNTDAPGACYISDLATSDSTPSASAGSFYAYAAAASAFQLGGTVFCNTNTSSQARTRLQISAAGTSLNISTIGWNDSRGRNA
jgi:hypothetical protein